MSIVRRSAIPGPALLTESAKFNNNVTGTGNKGLQKDSVISKHRLQSAAESKSFPREKLVGRVAFEFLSFCEPG